MSKLARRTFIVCVIAGALAACSAPPAPLAARRGATISIALAGELVAGNDAVGFGGDVLATNPVSTGPVPQYDDQRGELVLALRVPGTSTTYSCKTRFVTRIAPDPASRAAIRGAIGVPQGFEALATAAGLGEVVALVDLPNAASGITPGSYELVVSRRRRTGASSWETLPSVGYPASATYRIEILAGDEAPSGLSVDGGLGNTDARDGLRSLYPYPKLVLALPAGSAFGGATAPPAAARIVLSYPAAKITVQSVLEEQHGGRGSIVSWAADEPTGRLTVDLVAPPPTSGIEPVRKLAVAFDLDDRSGNPSARVASSDFAVVTGDTHVYDANGVEQTGAVVVEAGLR